jgi:hypothetical protein
VCSAHGSDRATVLEDSSDPLILSADDRVIVQIAIKQGAQCPGRTQPGVPSDWPIDEGARNT